MFLLQSVTSVTLEEFVSSTLLLWWIRRNPQGLRHFFRGGLTRNGESNRIHPLFATTQVMKSYSAKAEEIKSGWYLVDAQGKVLGRLASQIAARLRGKHKPEFTPHVDGGDFIVVVNAAKVRVTGRKALNKKYYRHTTFPGGIRETTFADLQAKHPTRALEKAVKGMLPKGPLGYAMLRKLKVYAGDTHPHSAQQPQSLEI